MILERWVHGQCNPGPEIYQRPHNCWHAQVDTQIINVPLYINKHCWLLRVNSFCFSLSFHRYSTYVRFICTQKTNVLCTYTTWMSISYTIHFTSVVISSISCSILDCNSATFWPQRSSSGIQNKLFEILNITLSRSHEPLSQYISILCMIARLPKTSLTAWHCNEGILHETLQVIVC